LQEFSDSYDQTTATRRRGLVAAFDAAELQGKGLRGALVHIPHSPFDVAHKFACLPPADLFRPCAARALAVLAWLGDSPANRTAWRDIARADRAVKTTLAALGALVSGRLVFHGCVLAAANLHIILGMRLASLPQLATFVALATEDE
jgi:hypothetical protein